MTTNPYLSGNFALTKTQEEVTLKDVNSNQTESLTVDLLTIGGSEGRAFAGVNGPETNPEAMGIYLKEVSFAMALMSAPRPEPTGIRMLVSGRLGQRIVWCRACSTSRGRRQPAISGIVVR